MSLGQCGGAGGFFPLPFGLPSSGLAESGSGILPLVKLKSDLEFASTLWQAELATPSPCPPR